MDLKKKVNSKFMLGNGFFVLDGVYPAPETINAIDSMGEKSQSKMTDRKGNALFSISAPSPTSSPCQTFAPVKGTFVPRDDLSGLLLRKWAGRVGVSFLCGAAPGKVSPPSEIVLSPI